MEARVNSSLSVSDIEKLINTYFNRLEAIETKRAQSYEKFFSLLSGANINVQLGSLNSLFSGFGASAPAAPAAASQEASESTQQDPKKEETESVVNETQHQPPANPIGMADIFGQLLGPSGGDMIKKLTESLTPKPGK